MALTLIQQVRLLVQDNDVTFPFLSDDEISFFLERNESNVDRSAIEAAKVILLQLSMRSSSETVDIFTITGKNAAEQYRMALELFLKSPSMNPVLNGIVPYAGGISLSDIQANNDNADNNIICTPLMTDTSVSTFGV